MSINGKYETYESETFTIQLSMNDLSDLNILFKNQINMKSPVIKPRVQAKKFIEMVHQAVDSSDFGFNFFHIDK